MKEQLLAMTVSHRLNMWLSNNRKNPSIMWFISNFFYMNSILNDRFDIFNEEDDYELHSRYQSNSINEVKNYKKLTLDECCEKRTNEIIDLARKLDKDIYVSWSGGVDSTCIVSSFMMNDRLDRKRFHILYSKDSINEYSFFYEILKKNKINLVLLNKLSPKEFDYIPKDNIVINGSCGDKLYVNDIDYPYRRKIYNFLKNPRKETYISDIIYNICKYFEYTNIDYYISKIEKYINTLDIQISSFHELMWLLHYAFWWNRTSLFRSMFSEYPELRIAYYDTTYFSAYGYQRYINKADYNRYYKPDMKKIIFQLTKDEEYFLHKGKYFADMIPDKNKNVYMYYKSSKKFNTILLNSKEQYYNFIYPFIKEKYINKIYIDSVYNPKLSHPHHV